MDYYSKHAGTLSERYNRLDPEDVHQSWKHLIVNKNGLALDVGAGSGRDSRWLASHHWDIVAVEPCKNLREFAQENNTISSSSITWIDDKLPDLKKVRALDYSFNLIVVSAVWMHILEKDRKRSFRILSDLLAPDGILVITLRHGTNANENSERNFYQVSREELEHFARQRAVISVSSSYDPDKLNRNDVKWETCVFQLPDDGTGNLPLLRHIIVNDNKAATYKLGLLRALIRIAEGCPGMVIKRTEAFVSIPFGLVALYWIKLYMPLVLKNHLIQAQRHNPKTQYGLGFAKLNHFYALSNFSPYDLRIGAEFNKEQASIIIGALNDVCTTIKNMPAHFITYPGQEQQVFQCNKLSAKKTKGSWQINKHTLSQFGVFHIPIKLWSTMGNFACWLEPAIINEWVRLMMGYELRYDRSLYDKAMQWEEGIRDTSKVRKRVEVLLNIKESVKCVWTNSNLKGNAFHVDHCFPWSRWANNDLWNLMPATIKANQQKSEKLPSAATMELSKERILQWWDIAYLNSEYKERFLLESEAALPGLGENTQTLGSIFGAVKHQRNRLRVNQQLVEW